MNNGSQYIAQAQAISIAIESALVIEADTKNLLRRFYDVVGHVRNMSRDARWKAPCNAYRGAYQRREVDSAITTNHLCDLASRFVHNLPTDVALEPLNYEDDGT